MSLLLPLRTHCKICSRWIELHYQNNPDLLHLIKKTYLLFKVEDGYRNSCVVLQAVLLRNPSEKFLDILSDLELYKSQPNTLHAYKSIEFLKALFFSSSSSAMSFIYYLLSGCGVTQWLFFYQNSPMPQMLPVIGIPQTSSSKSHRSWHAPHIQCNTVISHALGLGQLIS